MLNLKKEQHRKDTGLYLMILYTISIICGATLMSLEIAGGRLLSPFFGSSVYVWGSVISVFLIALSIGYYYGGILSDKKPELNTLGYVIAVSGLLMFFIPFLLPSLVDFAYDVEMLNYGALFVAMGLFFLPSVGLAMVSPYIVKLGMHQDTHKVGKLVGKFYAVSTFGSIVGTLGTTFVLIPMFGVRQMIYAMGTILVLLTVLVFIFNKKFRETTACLLIISLALTFSVLYKPRMALSVERGDVIYERETLYNNLSVVDGWDGLRYLLFNETEQSAMSHIDTSRHIWPYTYLMTAAADHYRPKAKRELLIGLGGGTIPKYTYDKRPNVKMDTVEIDPAVVNIAKEYFYLKDNDRIRNYADDGRVFLQNKKDLYDVVLIDAYNRQSIPYHLTTKEFFHELANAMKPDGVVVFNVVAGVEGENGKFLKSLLKTINQVFKNRKLYFAENRDSLEQLNNLILVVSNGELKGDEVDGFKAYTGQIDTGNSLVLTDDYAPVENLAASIMMK